MRRKSKAFKFNIFLPSIFFILLFAQSAFAAYSLTSNGIIIARNDGSGFSYDYAPTVIVEGTSTKVWWCGHGAAGGDNIFYSEKIGAGAFSTPQVVLTPTQAWETTHTCDPSVIKGSWTIGGTTYTYAMYYGAAAEVAGGVTSTKIGVAFSNNGTSWTKYASNPIISNLDSNYDYGVGMMSAYSTGGSNVTLAYFDQRRNEASIVRTSTNGLAFSNPYRLPFSGLDTIGDLAYSSTESKWYYTSKNQESKHVDGTDHADRESFLFRTNGSSLFNNDWSYVGVVSQGLTGYYMNHNPAWYRTTSGNMYESAGDRYVTFGAQTANSGTVDPNSWDLGKVTLSGTPSAISAPGAFSLSAPANSSTNLDPRNVTFTWGSSSNANNYILTVSESSSLSQFDSGSTTPIVTSIHATSYRAIQTSFNINNYNFVLEPSKTYYWSVKAVNQQGGVISTNGPFSFTTRDYAAWDFNGSGDAGYQKWFAQNGAAASTVGAGRAVFNLTATDNLISLGGAFVPVNLDLATKNKLVVKLKNKSTANTLRAYYALMDDPYWGENSPGSYRYKDFQVVPNDTYYREYVLDMTGSVGWSTAGKRLALLKFNFYGTGKIELDNVMITGNSFARADIKAKVLRIAATSSSNLDVTNYPPSSAIDNHDATMWVSAGHPSESFTESLVVDTGKSDKVTKVRFTPRSDGLAVPKDFKIYVSDNQGSWGTAVVTQTNYPVVSTEQVFTLGTAKVGRYIKFEATKLRTDGGATYYLQIPELHADRDIVNMVSIVNADFESAFTNWNKWVNNGDPSVVFTATNTITGVSGVNGSQYYGLVFDAVGTAGSMYRTITGLQAGATYKITVWAQELGRNAKLELRNFGGATISTSATSSVWTPISLNATLGGSNTTIEIHCYGETGSAWSYANFDNLEVVKQ